MAEVTIILGVPHIPFLYGMTRPPREQWAEDTLRMMERVENFRQRLQAARPDALIMVGNDHFHQFFMDNMPGFLLAKMPTYDGVFFNERREFSLPPCRVPGDEALAQGILQGLVDRGVDMSFSNELRLDHSVVVPLMMVRPEMDLPIVPILSNCIAPPMPTGRRFYEVGRALRSAVEAVPGQQRIAVVAAGNLSLEVGGPTQFAPHPSDEQFDDDVVRWIRDGDTESFQRTCTLERLTATGNVSHAVMNYLLAMGVAEGFAPTHVEGMKRAGSTQPFFAWEPAGGPS